MKTRNLIIVLLVLVGVLAVVRLTKKTGKSKALTTELVSLDTANITLIQITSPAGQVKLEKDNNTWQVALKEGSFKKARKGAVKSLLSNLAEISPDRLASRKQEKWKDYAVDSTGTRVQIYEGNDLVTDIVVGRFAMDGQRSYYTFVRPFNDENVYVANDFMGVSIGKKPEDYRDGLLMRLQKDSLTRIAFNYPDTGFVLKKGEKWYLDDAEADSGSVENYLRGLSYVNSKLFFDDIPEGAPTHTIVYSFSNAPDLKIEGFFSRQPRLIRSSANDVEVFQDSTIVRKIFAGKNAFIGSPN